MSSTTTKTTSIHKVRRDVRGGKRGEGWGTRFKRIRRADPTRIHAGKADATLTGCAGLASFGVFCREQGIDAEFEKLFCRLKSGRLVVYPMEAQLRLLLDANVAGEARVFGLEAHRIRSSSVSPAASCRAGRAKEARRVSPVPARSHASTAPPTTRADATAA
jgi:hypothetical protein